jgi:hypothetical protein
MEFLTYKVTVVFTKGEQILGSQEIGPIIASLLFPDETRYERNINIELVDFNLVNGKCRLSLIQYMFVDPISMMRSVNEYVSIIEYIPLGTEKILIAKIESCNLFLHMFTSWKSYQRNIDIRLLYNRNIASHPFSWYTFDGKGEKRSGYDASGPRLKKILRSVIKKPKTTKNERWKSNT